MQVDQQEISQEFTIPADLDHVWDMLINQDGLKRWFDAKIFEINPYEGGEIDMLVSFDGDEYRVKGETALLLPKERFSFSWIELDEFGFEWSVPTMIHLYFEEDKSGTNLTLVHGGFKYLPADIREDTFLRYHAYWQGEVVSEHLLTIFDDRV